MKATILKAVEIDIKYLKVVAGVRYWEDAEINGVDDTENGENIPCKEGVNWCPIINIETGRITNWEQGKTASIHYKVCDEGEYWLCDAGYNEVYKYRGHYVPDVLYPKEDGYGDYIIMDIDTDGYIKDFKIDIQDFIDYGE